MALVKDFDVLPGNPIFFREEHIKFLYDLDDASEEPDQVKELQHYVWQILTPANFGPFYETVLSRWAQYCNGDVVKAANDAELLRNVLGFAAFSMASNFYHTSVDKNRGLEHISYREHHAFVYRGIDKHGSTDVCDWNWIDIPVTITDAVILKNEKWNECYILTEDKPYVNGYVQPELHAVLKTLLSHYVLAEGIGPNNHYI